MSDARFLSTPGSRKNVVVRFTSAGEMRVLKVFRHSPRYAARLLTNPVSRWVTRAFTLRGTARQRLAAEVRGIEGFRAAGLRTFEVLEQPCPVSLVYAFCHGRDVKSYLRKHPARTTAYVERAARELAQRQRLAMQSRDVRLVHPQPRLNHTWRRRRDGEFAYFDFEDRVNPSLGLEHALALEVESFFRGLVRFELSRAPALLSNAARQLAGAPFDRWRAIAHRPRALSGSARRRRGVFEQVAAARQRHARDGRA